MTVFLKLLSNILIFILFQATAFADNQFKHGPTPGPNTNHSTLIDFEGQNPTKNSLDTVTQKPENHLNSKKRHFYRKRVRFQTITEKTLNELRYLQ